MLGLAAVNTGNNLLYLILACLLGLMIVSGMLGRANLARFKLHLALPDEIYAGQPTSAGLTLKNLRRRLPLFLMVVTLDQESVRFIAVSAGDEDEQPLSLTFKQRGQQRLAGVELSSPFPVGFFQRRAWLPLDQQVLVLPQPRACTPPSSSGAQRLRGESTSAGRGDDGDLLAVTDYSGREPLKLIHWKQSARHDSIKVKELAAVRSQPLWVRLEDCPGQTLEERLGQAAYLINLFWRSGRPVGLHLGERTLAAARGRRHRLRLLRELALYDPA